METLIVYEIMPSGSGVDSSWDCSHVDCVLVEALLNQLLVSLLTSIANKIAPSAKMQKLHLNETSKTTVRN